MLGRAVVPRLRPRLFGPPLRFAILNQQSRHYARDRKFKSSDDYRPSPTAKRPAWEQQSIRREHDSIPEPQAEQEFRTLSREQQESLLTEDNNSKSQGIPQASKPSPLDPKNDYQESIPFETTEAQPSEEPSDQSEEELAKLRASLPDITQGIPSTLAAELSQARSRQKGASPASLNITEDPDEPTVTGQRGGDDSLPKTSYISSSDQKRTRVVRIVFWLMFLGAAGYTANLGRNWNDEEEEKKHPNAPSGWGLSLFYNRVKARLGSTLNYYQEPMAQKLLPDENADPNLRFPFTLVLSLEDMLIHNEWTREHGWRIAKRPGLDYFLRYLCQYYELVLFTSQPSSFIEPVLRKLDPYTVIQLPLFREATLYKDGGYIKDLSYLNRPLRKVLIIDTDPHHVKHQPENAIILPKWKGDPNDQTLVQLIPFLEYLATMGFDDARTVLKSFEGTFIPAEFARREKLLREKFYEKRQAENKKGKKPSVGGIAGALGWKSNKPQLIDPTTGKPIKEEPLDGDKMLWDQIRERGQANYIAYDKLIREEGEKLLKQREEEEKKFQEEAMKNMKDGILGYFGLGKKEKE